jgi:hypothetical protein
MKTMAADLTLLYLGYAALLLAAVLLRLPAMMRAGFFAVVVLSMISGAQDRTIEREGTEIIVAAA